MLHAAPEKKKIKKFPISIFVPLKKKTNNEIKQIPSVVPDSCFNELTGIKCSSNGAIPHIIPGNKPIKIFCIFSPSKK
jgi:hypothetical protein